MPAETFTERFNRLTAHMSELELASTLGLSVGALRKLRTGDTQSLKLLPAIRLARKLNVTAEYLAEGDTKALARAEDALVQEYQLDYRDRLAAVEAKVEDIPHLRAMLADLNDRVGRLITATQIEEPPNQARKQGRRSSAG